MENIDKRAEAARMAAEGKSYRQIAKALDVPAVTVYSWLPTKEEQSQFADMARMRSEGMTNVQIARKLGVNPKRVSAVLGPLPRTRDRYERRQVRLKPGTYEALKTTAATMGLHVGRGEHATMGSIGQLLDAIAAGEIDLSWKDGYGPLATAPEDAA